MIKKIILGLALCLSVISVKSQFNLKNIIEKNTGTKTLSSDDIIKVLKEALNKGVDKATVSASAVDGFFKNDLIKIPFPPEAKSMDETLRNLGMGSSVDKFIETLNRAAEEAAKKAAPIFLDAIKKLTITDGLSILKGNNNAATQYLRDKTTNDLKIQFKPVIQAALQKVELTKYWNPLISKYNMIPFVQKLNPDLDEYVTLRAIDGLFKLIEGEEFKIRQDPAARTTDILKKVFGN